MMSEALATVATEKLPDHCIPSLLADGAFFAIGDILLISDIKSLAGRCARLLLGAGEQAYDRLIL